MSDLSSRIQQLRKQLGISQQELAARVQASKSMINRYETKNVQPPADILNRIADVLNTSVDFLINGDSEEKAKATLKNSELLNTLKEIDVMPENEQNMLLHYVNAYIRDFKARKAYAL
jgi:transcriptional regulator with XRE-family HTH domain